MCAAQVGDHGGAVLAKPGDFLVATPLAWSEVEVNPILDRLCLGHFDEQDAVSGPGVADDALLVARKVGVASMST